MNSQISSTFCLEIERMHTIELTNNWATLVVAYRKQVKPSVDSAPLSCFPQYIPSPVLATVNIVSTHLAITFITTI